MKHDFRIRALAILLALAGMLACAGCGAGGTVVEGKLVANGQPYTVNEEKEELQLTFIEGEGENMKTYPATVAQDGTFSVIGPSGRGIPAGNYKIVVQSIPYGGDQGDSDDDNYIPDKFGGKFGAEKTPLTIEVPASEMSPITIDLKKGTVIR